MGAAASSIVTTVATPAVVVVEAAAAAAAAAAATAITAAVVACTISPGDALRLMRGRWSLEARTLRLDRMRNYNAILLLSSKGLLTISCASRNKLQKHEFSLLQTKYYQRAENGIPHSSLVPV